ncbi:MAG: L-threonylcarbamoyladenylate synthase [Herbaspirillum sp.]
MSQFFQIHPDNPQLRLIRQAAQIIQGGGIVALPTDADYTLVCRIDDKSAMERLRRIRGVDDRHHLTLLCRDLSEIAQYARIDNRQYRLLKAVIPGPYTFILEAGREVPRRLSNPSRKTIGLRVPENPVSHALLAELGQVLIGATLICPDQGDARTNAQDIHARLKKQIELVIDSGACSMEPTTVIDLSDDDGPMLMRQGRGDAAPFGL